MIKVCIFCTFRLLDWRPEKSFQKKRFEQVVIIKHVFHPDEFEVSLIYIEANPDPLAQLVSPWTVHIFVHDGLGV